MSPLSNFRRAPSGCVWTSYASVGYLVDCRGTRQDQTEGAPARALDKLLDCFINIVAGGLGLIEITPVCVRSSFAACIWTYACAEQSTVRIP